jgi:hypothetical protein
MIGLLFWLMTALTCAYALLNGGRDGRWAASLILTASVLSLPASLYGAHFGRFEPAVFTIDLGLLIGLYIVALRSRSWWPIWMTGFHLVAVVSHLATLISPNFVANIYFAAATFWAVPISLSMMIGVALDHRAKRAAEGRNERPVEQQWL